MPGAPPHTADKLRSWRPAGKTPQVLSTTNLATRDKLQGLIPLAVVWVLVSFLFGYMSCCCNQDVNRRFWTRHLRSWDHLPQTFFPARTFNRSSCSAATSASAKPAPLLGLPDNASCICLLHVMGVHAGKIMQPRSETWRFFGCEHLAFVLATKHQEMNERSTRAHTLAP